MKKNSVLIALLMSSTAVFGCQVTVTNTTRDAQITVFDEQSNETRKASEGQAVKGNTDANSHAHLIITITHDNVPTRIYRVTQFSCSKSHEIPISTTQIIHGIEKMKMSDDMDLEQLLKVEQIQ